MRVGWTLADSFKFLSRGYVNENRLNTLCGARYLYSHTPVCKMSSGARPKVYVTRRIPQSALDLLQARCDVTQWDSDAPVPREEILNNVQDVDALYCLLTDKIDAKVLDAAGPNLKVIGTMSVGYDHIDVGECARRGLPVGYTPDVLTDATAELTLALLLATSRRIPEGVSAVKSGAWGSWVPLWMCGPGLAGSTVGIVGLGRIGLAVAKRLRPFNIAKLLYTGSSPKSWDKEVDGQFVDFDSLLAESDFVIACCAFTPQTKDLFNLATFRKMKKTAVFVNTSRGGVVQQDDLCEALKTGDIRAAGLDVTTPEPLPTDSPLLKLDNCVILPHIGSATVETRTHMAVLTSQNILAALDGKPMPAQIKT